MTHPGMTKLSYWIFKCITAKNYDESLNHGKTPNTKRFY